MQNRSCVEFVELSNRRQFAKKWIFYDEAIKETRYDLREALAPFLPENSLDEVVAMMQKYPAVLRIETPRKESLGYCKWGITIGINNDLDKDRFLSVLLHEYAHLITYLTFPKAATHGTEFYYCFQKLILKFIQRNIISEEMFLPIVNRSGDYEFLKKHFGFKFAIKKIKVGRQAIYKDEIIIRGKGRQGLINCIRLSDNSKSKLSPNTEVIPVLDLNW